MSPITSLGIALTGIYISICSWCKCIVKEIPAEKPGTTHTICNKCFNKLMKEVDDLYKSI